MITSQNIFAALDTKKKKKSSKSKDADEKKKKKEVSKADRSAELERAIFSGPKVSISNWADTDEDDDFVEELPESWSAPVQSSGKPRQEVEEEEQQEDDSDEEDHDEAIQRELGVEFAKDDEEDEEEHPEDESERVQTMAQEVASKPVLPVEKMLSKKEIKAREMEELARTLAELGIEAPQQAAEGEAAEAGEEKKKKKKEKKKGKAEGDTPAEATNGTATAKVEAPVEEEEEETVPVDPAEAKRLLAKKKAAAQKKSATSAASQAAAREAKERAKKAKGKKDTSHFNQAPTR
ncbi:hypothetical protein WJX75_009245 [Coccomyxa subellipsoidea]|uniref:Uncharacterized protein n=1 Tax=Coccomyxa subellipsoidea TaxID=248742 RepID=A0ABR2YS31_9CHLO